jgi:Rad3-related DNA helicase
MTTPERSLLLTVTWRRPGRDTHLALDLPAGTAVLELTDLARTPTSRRGAVLVGGPAAECRSLPDGGLLVGEGVLWALLDPLAAAPGVLWPGATRFEAETFLREGAARFRRRVSWWRGLEAKLRDGCRDLLRGHKPDLAPLLDLLDTIPLPVQQAGADGATPAGDEDSGRPVPAPCPADPERLHAWFFADDGLGAVIGQDYAPREEQADMARQVARALAHGSPLLIEAGTGVGKTLAYLAPLVAAVRSGETRAVVSTHTRALQSQILNQDLPRLAPLLGGRRFELLMGRRQYLCWRQRQGFLTRPVETFADALRAAAFRLWLHETRDGRRDEVAAHAVLEPAEGELFDSAEVCVPGACYDGDRCFVQRARRLAREADIVLVNHALLLQDRRAGGTLLGEFDHLVVDEAHRLPAVTLDAHTVALGTWRLSDLDDLLGSMGGGDRIPERIVLAARRLAACGVEGERAGRAAEDLGGAVRRLHAAFRAWWQELGERVDEALPGQYRDTSRARIRDRVAFFGPVRARTAVLLEEMAAAEGAFASFAARAGMIEEPGGALEDDLAQIAQAGQVLRQLHADAAFLTADDEDEWVSWYEPARGRGLARLGATLLEAGAVLRDYWQDADLRPVMTSATLAVGEDFSHMLGELGLSRRRPSTPTWTSPSPFDYHRQALILTPQHFPDPGAPDFGRAVGETLAGLAAAAPHKTLGLFTSYRAISDAVDALAAAGFPADVETGDGPLILAQTPRTSTAALLERFRGHRRAMLLGTATFWEGVDFPGEDLEILVVAKLPFLVPSDPWVEARCERLQAMGENPFTQFMVRDAVLRLRQGVGRLIRRREDRGVVLLLDNRLHTKNYGTTFLGALPVLPASYGDDADLRARIEDFFRRT